MNRSSNLQNATKAFAVHADGGHLAVALKYLEVRSYES